MTAEARGPAARFAFAARVGIRLLALRPDGSIAAGVALAAIALSAIAASPAPSLLTATADLRPDGAATAQQPRPFRHDEHRALSCSGCHGPAERHRVARVWAARDCAACHHDAARGYECARCHDASNLPAPRVLAAAMELTVWDEPRRRDLLFDHATHAARSCQECHEPPVTGPPIVRCSMCHAEHHRPEANCSTCHRPTPRAAHGLTSHVTCAGSGCHTRDGTTRPVFTRELCLLCHAEQTDHEPGSTCHVCHKIPAVHPERSGF
jgi:hypothetical protein